jgi:LysM repeat protein
MRGLSLPLVLPAVLMVLGGPASAQLEPVGPAELLLPPSSRTPALASLPTFSDRLWVKVHSSVSIGELALALALDLTHLAVLNSVDEDHLFHRGDWLVFPSQSSRRAKQLASIDTSQLRRSPPLEVLPLPQEPAVVRYGDSLVKIALRYNLTISDLLRLNPGLEAARLVPGTQLRLAKTSQWPDTPLPKAPLKAPQLINLDQLGGPAPRRFDQSLDELVRDGVVSRMERAHMQGGGGAMQPPDGGAHQRACSTGSLSSQECRSGVAIRWGRQPGGLSLPAPAPAPINKTLSPNEQALLQRIRSGVATPQWRTYGQCNYDWGGWKLHSNGVRTTGADCGGTAMRWQIGVSCDRLLVATHTTASGWSKWVAPSGPDSKFRQGEDEMVAALCANVAGPHKAEN